MRVRARRRNAAIGFGTWGLLLLIGLVLRSGLQREAPSADSPAALRQRVALLEQENAALKARLALPDKLDSMVGGYKALPARLRHLPMTGLATPDLSPPRHSCVLDVGARDGVRKGQGVVATTGVVGRVAKVYSDHCRVHFADDVGFVAHFRLHRRPGEGIARGDAFRPGNLRPQFLRDRVRFIDGDLLITAGSDGVFPRGIALGVVDAVAPLPQDTRIVAAVDFGALSEVAVLLPPGPNESD
ncbi:MAG: rod shape-determining protein MreC [Planctomycetota bacterium]